VSATHCATAPPCLAPPLRRSSLPLGVSKTRVLLVVDSV
jgi:hypothetical protein